jgi:hypothetical protein
MVDRDGSQKVENHEQAQRGLLSMTRPWPLVYAAMLFGIIGLLNFIAGPDAHNSGLAESFLAGKLHFLSQLPNGWGDTAPFAGYHYWPGGPLPAVLSMPLVWSGYYHLGVFSFVVSLLVFFLCYRLARKCDYRSDEGCWFALAFCFASSYIGVSALAVSSSFAHLVAGTMLFLAINEYQGRSRLWLTGGLIGLAMASRPPAGINILFFVLAIVLGAGTFRERSRGLIKLLLPFAAVVALLAVYNFARFGNPFETGYSFQLNGFGKPYAGWNVPGNNAGPALSLSYIPEHFWIFFFGLPSVSAIGTSVLLLSPYLFYLMSVPRWDLTNRLIGLNVAAVLMAVLAFRSTGFEQMGYRFSLDFLPFVFWLLMRSHIPMSGRLKGLILISTILDICLTAFFLATGVDRRQG